jgi:hypothetical protein|tara:strand:- start:413 stop:565 length:153 start_codon:yes stop_codon:yes gene_type:complete
LLSSSHSSPLLPSQFCYDKACPVYSSGAISPAIGAATVAVAAAGALFLAA